MKQDTSVEAILQKALPDVRLLSARPLSGGISASMTALEIEKPSGEKVSLVLRQSAKAVLAQNPQAAELEYRLLTQMAKQGIKAPHPVKLLHAPPALLLTYLPGKPRFPKQDDFAFAKQLAEQLAKIHRLPVNKLDFLPKQSSRIRPLTPKHDFNELFNEEAIFQALAPHWPPAPNANTLIHGDFWHGNFLWQNGKLSGIIDWEDAEVGSPLFDLAVSRLDLCWISSPEIMQDFTQHYLSQNPLDTAALPLWDLFAALRLIRLAGSDLEGWTAFFHPFGRSDITPALMVKRVNCFVNKALKKLR